ncbi:MAG: hypothetical protein ACU85E_12345, partial [Gammaproteobacteria bacterium]
CSISILRKKLMKHHEIQTGHGIRKMMHGGIVASGVQIGKKLISGAAKHTLLIFGLGTLAGIYIYKKRKDIIDAAEQIEEQAE